MTEQGKRRGEDGRNVARPCREEDPPQPLAEPTAQAGTARELIEAYFSAVFEMVDPKIFADDLMECLSAKGYKIMPREPTRGMLVEADCALTDDIDKLWKVMWDAAP